MRRLAPALLIAAFVLAPSAPALADVESGTPKQDMPAENDDDESKGGGCSVAGSKLGLAGCAALVLLISGATLRRRE